MLNVTYFDSAKVRFAAPADQHDRRAHPELPADAVVRGRLIAAHVEGEDGRPLKLSLFTTLEEPGKCWWSCIGGGGRWSWTFGP